MDSKQIKARIKKAYENLEKVKAKTKKGKKKRLKELVVA
jgi:hypothetical protein